MTEFKARYGPWALVAGAADGLGAAYSRALARRGFHLLMVDIQADLLEQLASELSRTHRIQTDWLVQDLGKREALDRLQSWVGERPCHLLVYNAAYGPVKLFTDNESDELDLYLEVNARLPLQLSHWLVKRWQAGETRGGIVLMSSLAGLRGTQLVAPYAATKAFAWNLAEALYHEFRELGIDVLGVCPGTMRTRPYLSSNPKKMPLQPPIQEPDAVAEEVLAALGRQPLLIPGRYNRLTDRFLNWLPRRMAVRIMNDSMRKIYPTVWHAR